MDYAQSDWEYRDVDSSASWNHKTASGQLWWDTYLVNASSLAQARSILPLLRSEGKAHRFILVVEGHFADDKGPWTSRSLRTKAAMTSWEITGLGTAVEVAGGNWVDVHTAALAALQSSSVSEPVAVLGGLRAGIVNSKDRAWIAGDTLGGFLTERLLEPEPDDIYSVDVVLGAVELPEVPGRVTPVICVPGPEILPPVDTAVISPAGFRSDPKLPSVALAPHAVAASGQLSEIDIRGFRDHKYVVVDGAIFAGQEWNLARCLTQLAVAGIPTLATNVGPRVTQMVGEPLYALLTAFDDHDSSIVRESKSISMRREAIRHFSPLGRWHYLLGGAAPTLSQPPAVSALLATRRPDKVAFALDQLSRQNWHDLEVVLVMHGFDDGVPEVRQAIKSYPRELQVLSVPSTTVFGDVLNAGTAAAKGSLITKIDDDDWYGPNHITDLVQAMGHSGAMLVGAQVEFVYLGDLDITTRRPNAGERYSDHVAGGTMMIPRDQLLRLGGWRPVHRAVDRCLLQAVQAAGGLIYRTHGQNYMMHRHASTDSHGGHTWNPEDSVFLQSVAGQWDGLVPPPQMGDIVGPETRRSEELRSFFAGCLEPGRLKRRESMPGLEVPS
ncbi:MAG: glycosyltransferase [Arthrobacter sp.]